MRFSEAIRLGAMLKPQAFGVIYGNNGGTCALGAAADALGRLDDLSREVVPSLSNIWPPEWDIVSQADPVRRLRCPDCFRRYSTAGVVAMHLNDLHCWTREAIADWVETTEQAEHAKCWHCRHLAADHVYGTDECEKCSCAKFLLTDPERNDIASAAAAVERSSAPAKAEA